MANPVLKAMAGFQMSTGHLARMLRWSILTPTIRAGLWLQKITKVKMSAGPPQAHFLRSNRLWKSTPSEARDFFTSE
jgi:hypothetical protein